ncbi:substrate-binding domain-containing protein [Microbacterium sp. JC 701]|uniref:substrate-binding domain-containing protein n=1 Tax=Microbacterium sp. JC 701 TaxID=2897389 RepID=UPI001E55AD49|nr:substrate-binding domain-containing protein [Microbacterium sp. JC 701]MCD2171266.1 substrate-binding domain-containing protein [Microbacterium sp. JC 701]
MPARPILRAAAALALVAVALTGCTSSRAQTQGSNDGAGVIGVSLPTEADAQWSRGGDALKTELVARGYAVDLQFAAGDARTQGSQVQNMLTKGADAVVVAPVAAGDLAAPLEVANGDGVPVVEFGRSLAGVDAAAAFAPDPTALGRAQAEALLADLPSSGSEQVAPDAATEPSPSPSEAPSPAASAPATPTVARVALITGSSADPWDEQRFAAALDALQPAIAAGTVQLVSGASLEAAAVDEDTAAAQAAAAEKRLRALRADADAPTAVLALGDAVTRGVVTALTTDPPAEESPSPSPRPTASSTPEAPAPLVVGTGADAATVRALRDDVLDATIFADPRALVDATADAVQALLDGETPAAAGEGVAPSVVRPDDVEELISSGWISTDEL